MGVLTATLVAMLLTATMIVPTSASAASRGVQVQLKASESAGAPDAGTVTLYGASHALVIGIDKYTGGWPRLSNAVNDARAVAEELDRQGFQVTLETDLKSDALRVALRQFFAIKGSDPAARLLLWYAGHGETMKGEGFLVPADAPLPNDTRFKVKALHMRDFGGLVRLAEAKHVLSVFDSCFSGTIFAARGGTPKPITKKTTKPVRQFLTSGGAGQQVRDDGSFRKLFIRALRGEERADANLDGYLTGEELGLFLSQEVATLTSAAQTPKHGKLHDVEFNQGDFVFVLPGAAGGGGSAAPQAEIVVWQTIKDSTSPAMFEEYLRQFPDGQFSAFARVRLKELKGEQVAALPPQPTAPSGEQVREAQQLLAALGYSPGPADGNAGRNTRTAIESFQRSNGLNVDGTVTDVLIVSLKFARTQVAAVRPATPPPAVVMPTQPAVGVYPRRRNPGDTFKDCRECPEMVVIPAGSFRMGDLSGDGRDNEKPVHQVTISKPFAVGKYEVTRGEFAAFIRESGHNADGSCYVLTGSTWKADSSKNWRNPGFKQTDRDPVVCVSWKDAKAYARWLGRDAGVRYRLLSEAEWEYVARAGSTSKFPFGNSESSLCEHGNTADRSTGFDWRNKSCSDGYGEQTAPGGSFKPNAFGVYDTIGNVYEWTEDCWHGNYNGAPTNGGAWTSGGECSRRVLRGGSWVNEPWLTRSAYRYRDDSSNRNNFNGFRVARTF